MANLHEGTTIGGHIAITAKNIYDYLENIDLGGGVGDKGTSTLLLHKLTYEDYISSNRITDLDQFLPSKDMGLYITKGGITNPSVNLYGSITLPTELTKAHWDEQLIKLDTSAYLTKSPMAERSIVLFFNVSNNPIQKDIAILCYHMKTGIWYKMVSENGKLTKTWAIDENITREYKSFTTVSSTMSTELDKKLSRSNNLSDIDSVIQARRNLGIVLTDDVGSGSSSLYASQNLAKKIDDKLAITTGQVSGLDNRLVKVETLSSTNKNTLDRLQTEKWDIQTTIGSGAIVRKSENDKKWDIQTTTGTGNVIRKSVTDDLSNKVTTAQNRADSAYTLADGKWSPQTTSGTGNIIRQTELDKKWNIQTTTGTGNIVRTSVTDALSTRVTTAQSRADSAHSLATTANNTANSAYRDKGNLGTINLNTLGSNNSMGVYFQTANANATTARNYPKQEAGTLHVTKSAYGCQQMYITFSSGEIFVRGLTTTWNGSNGPWQGWIRIAKKSEVDSAYNLANSKWSPQTTEGTGNIIRKSVTDGLSTRITTAQNTANTAKTTADSALSKANAAQASASVKQYNVTYSGVGTWKNTTGKIKYIELSVNKHSHNPNSTMVIFEARIKEWYGNYTTRIYPKDTNGIYKFNFILFPNQTLEITDWLANFVGGTTSREWY